MAILARFRVNSVENFSSGSRPKLVPVYSPEDYESPEVVKEIRSFFNATPSGSLEMYISSAAAEQFQVDDEFYVELRKIPADQTIKAVAERRRDAAEAAAAE